VQQGHEWVQSLKRLAFLLRWIIAEEEEQGRKSMGKVVLSCFQERVSKEQEGYSGGE